MRYRGSLILLRCGFFCWAGPALDALFSCSGLLSRSIKRRSGEDDLSHTLFAEGLFFKLQS